MLRMCQSNLYYLVYQEEQARLQQDYSDLKNEVM